TPSDNGTYTATVTATDDDGGVGSASVIIKATNANPVVSVSPDQTVVEGSLVTVWGSFTDTAILDTHTVAWHVVDANRQVLAIPTRPSPDLTPSDNGTYTATFTATDDDGGIGSASVVITATNANPVVSVSPDQTVVE